MNPNQPEWMTHTRRLPNIGSKEQYEFLPGTPEHFLYKTNGPQPPPFDPILMQDVPVPMGTTDDQDEVLSYLREEAMVTLMESFIEPSSMALPTPAGPLSFGPPILPASTA